MRERLIQVTSGREVLAGNLTLPNSAPGVVLFAHGSGSSRHSPRNRYVARTLQQAGLGTLLIDLMTREEEQAEAATRHLRFDIDFLAERLSAASEWLMEDTETGHLPIGYFGASTGAAAALVSAAQHPERVAAVVSRGGRPDLAGSALSQVQAPVLLIVGGNDGPVIPLNQQALAQLTCTKELIIVPGATHLFEEPGTLEEVARLASIWFTRYLGAKRATSRQPRDMRLAS